MSTSPRVPWWWPTPRKLGIGALALVVIGAVCGGVWRATHCAPGIRRLGGECVGVTDGRFVFSPDLAPVMEKIREENRWVLAQGDRPFVSVAYLMPLPKAPNDVSEVYRHELQGAHLAQRRANHTNELGDQPLIRLIVANAGEDNAHWRPVTDQLVGMVGAEDRLVAVAGLGTSLETTRQAIMALTAHGIPVVGSRLTADDLSGKPGFARVGFTNRDQVKAAVAYLKRNFAFRRALLIQDTNPDDAFSKTLADAFAAEFPGAAHTLIEPTEVYNSSLGGVGNRLVQVITSICLHRPDVVYFAGGRPALEDFIEALPGRPCADFHINLVTGDSPSAHMDTPALRKGLRSRMTLRYTELTHPGAWADAPEAFPAASIWYFHKDCTDDENCFASLFRNESTDDGAAVLGHDAIVIAARAIRLATGARDLTQDPLMPGEVLQELSSLHDPHAVPGASGWISLDNAGDPINKAIPILAFRPDGSIEFIELSSPDGEPFRPSGPSPAA